MFIIYLFIFRGFGCFLYPGIRPFLLRFIFCFSWNSSFHPSGVCWLASLSNWRAAWNVALCLHAKKHAPLSPVPCGIHISLSCPCAVVWVSRLFPTQCLGEDDLHVLGIQPASGTDKILVILSPSKSNEATLSSARRWRTHATCTSASMEGTGVRYWEGLGYRSGRRESCKRTENNRMRKGSRVLRKDVHV